MSVRTEASNLLQNLLTVLNLMSEHHSSRTPLQRKITIPISIRIRPLLKIVCTTIPVVTMSI